MVLIIRDHVKGCFTNQEGDVIYGLIEEPILRGENVTISFKGITSVSSSFLNSAFMPLLEVTTYDQIKKCLSIIDSNKFINGMILKRFKQEQEINV